VREREQVRELKKLQGREREMVREQVQVQVRELEKVQGRAREMVRVREKVQVRELVQEQVREMEIRPFGEERRQRPGPPDVSCHGDRRRNSGKIARIYESVHPDYVLGTQVQADPSRNRMADSDFRDRATKP
jgi:hypothetical protein